MEVCHPSPKKKWWLNIRDPSTIRITHNSGKFPLKSTWKRFVKTSVFKLGSRNDNVRCWSPKWPKIRVKLNGSVMSAFVRCNFEPGIWKAIWVNPHAHSILKVRAMLEAKLIFTWEICVPSLLDLYLRIERCLHNTKWSIYSVCVGQPHRNEVRKWDMWMWAVWNP